MGLTVVLVNLGLAFLCGIGLSFHFVFNGLKMGNPWRWLVGLFGGLIVGTLVAAIDFWIIWPPANLLATVVGFAMMLLIILILLAYPRPWQPRKEIVTSEH